MKWSPALTALVLLLVLSISATAEPVQSVPDGRFYITVGDEQICTPYLSNQSIDETHPNRDRCVIILPGGSRDIEQVGDWMQQAAFQADALETTLLVGIQFLLETDVDTHLLNDDVVFWDHMAWYNGDVSDSSGHNPRYARASSFTFTDSLVYHIWQLNPHFETFVITGPSAGGKYTQRYAATNRIETYLAQNDGPPMIYTTINNGSFVYMDAGRRAIDGTFPEADDLSLTFIPRYNKYPYGLEELNDYSAETGSQTIYNQYRYRWGFYIIGELDNGPNSDDQPMALQGYNNIQRNVVYAEHLTSTYGTDHNHEVIVIEGADHNTHEIILDPTTWEPLFYFVPPESAVEEEGNHGGSSTLPQEASLVAYPNPFNPSTNLTVTLPHAGRLKVEVFNVAGQRVALLENAQVSAGEHAFTFAPEQQSSGVYFVHVTARGQFSEVRKITLLK
ncbi:T9SS type A sorting domain-containing protein [bacterium]|nr:T9SS type A sorting domain-containing protein [bacterium]